MEPLVRSWIRSLKARDLSPATVRVYGQSLRAFLDWLDGRNPDRWACEEFFEAQSSQYKPATVQVRYRALKLFFDWCVEEDELKLSPMTRLKAPKVPETDTKIFTKAELKALFCAAAGERRDLSLLHLLLDTGLRRGEVASLTLSDLNLDQQVLFVVGKGRKPRVVPFGKQTARSLDRYLRQRNLKSESLFGLCGGGIDKVLKSIAQRANVSGVHAHRFRHTFAHLYLLNEGSEGDLMQIGGWKSREVMDRYGRSLARERSLSRYRSPLDKL